MNVRMDGWHAYPPYIYDGDAVACRRFGTLCFTDRNIKTQL